MFRVNKEGFDKCYKPVMSYYECLAAFRQEGFGDIPFGEYLLMQGIVQYAASNTVSTDVIVSGLYNYSAPTPPITTEVTVERTVYSSSGLGDTIAKITHATGLDKLSELYTKITGQPCGCKDRQEVLNKLFPYGVKEES
jgi:hypothetical protein